MRSLVCNPLTPLVAFAVALTACLGLYLLAGLVVSPAFEALVSFGWVFLLVLWMDADARHRRQVPCFDFGLLVWQLFPLSVAWYCLWSRGWRGLLLIAGLVGLWLVPYVAVMLLWSAL